MNKLKKIEKFLRDEICYDGTPDKKCPHCNETIEEGSCYLYHYESMAGNLAHLLGLSCAIGDMIKDIFSENSYRATGNKKTDAEFFAKLVYELIYKNEEGL